MTVFLKAIHTS